MFKFGNLSDIFDSAGRVKTHNNETYVRNWWEVAKSLLGCKWVSYANGGGFSRWGGMRFDTVDWSSEGRAEYASHGGMPNPNALNRRGITWGLITSSDTSFRLKENYELFSSGSPTIIPKEGIDDGIIARYLALLNSTLSKALLNAFNPTLNTTVGDVLSLPKLPDNCQVEPIDSMSMECVGHVNCDWDSFETSWDFKRHPLV